MVACLDPIGSCPQSRYSRHLLKFMTQTVRGTSLEPADDLMGGERWWRRHGDVHAVGQDHDVLEIDRKRSHRLANQRVESLRCLPPEAGLGAHRCPNEM